MSRQLVYSSSLNGAAFLLFELKQAVLLKLKGYKSKEIREKIKKDNLFQYNNISRMERVLPSIMKRLEALDHSLCEHFSMGSVVERKILNLYAIMKTDLLFYEFMNEVIRLKMMDQNYYLEKKDLNVFFSEKAEQSERVAGWSEINKEKLKRVYLQILFESGLLKTRKGNELNPLFIEEDIRMHLLECGEEHYLQAMGDDGDLL